MVLKILTLRQTNKWHTIWTYLSTAESKPHTKRFFSSVVYSCSEELSYKQNWSINHSKTITIRNKGCLQKRLVPYMMYCSTATWSWIFGTKNSKCVSSCPNRSNAPRPWNILYIFVSQRPISWYADMSGDMLVSSNKEVATPAETNGINATESELSFSYGFVLLICFLDFLGRIWLFWTSASTELCGRRLKN